MQKPLHKFFRDYTNDEINKIINERCLKCKYSKFLNGYAYTIELKNKNRSCNFLVNTGSRRIVRPDLCPYYKEEAMAEYDHEKFVDFDIYCPKCEFKDLTENDDPCSECLACPARDNSHKPEKFKERVEK